jgi:hypothetical protein
MKVAGRQPVRKQLLTVAGPLGLVGLLAAAPARADELWAPSPLLPGACADAPITAFAGAVVRAESGVVPPFRSGARDRLSVGAEGAVWLGPAVSLRAEGAWLTTRTEAGGAASGAGDLRLGTVVRVARLERLEVGTGWAVKLPNAADEEELGTDETDVSFGAWAQWSAPSWRVRADAGLQVLGNPLRFANQDDVPVLAARAEAVVGPVRGGPVLEAQLATARNPARVRAGMRVEAGGRWYVSAEAWGGLTPADADGVGVLAVGWRGPRAPEALPGRSSGE